MLFVNVGAGSTKEPEDKGQGKFRPVRRGDRTVEIDLLPVAAQILQEVAEGHDRFAWRRTTSGTIADRLGQNGMGEKRAAACLERNDFRHDAITICHEHGFADCWKANLFAEPVLERLSPTERMPIMAAIGSYLCQWLGRPPLLSGELVFRPERIMI